MSTDTVPQPKVKAPHWIARLGHNPHSASLTAVTPGVKQSPPDDGIHRYSPVRAQWRVVQAWLLRIMKERRDSAYALYRAWDLAYRQLNNAADDTEWKYEHLE